MEAGQRPRAVAMHLRALLPTGSVFICWIADKKEGVVGVLDQQGNPIADWSNQFGGYLSSLAHSKPKQAMSDLEKYPVFVPDSRWLLDEGIQGQTRQTIVGLSVPASTPASEVGATRILLKTCCDHLSRGLYQQQEREELCRLAQVGSLAGPLTHEFNNFLNVVFLQIAILELDKADKWSSQIEEIRRQGKRFEYLIEQFNTYRRGALHFFPLSLNEAMTQFFGRQPGVEFRLADNLPQVWGTHLLFHHLFTFLWSFIKSRGYSSVTVATEQQRDKILLRLSLPKAENDEEDVLSLEWAACQSVASRFDGKAYQKQSKDGGLDLVIEFAPSTRPLDFPQA
jgi:hypothetical protein